VECLGLFKELADCLIACLRTTPNVCVLDPLAYPEIAVIGDIHGELRVLQDALTLVPPKAAIVFTGDYFNARKDSQMNISVALVLLATWYMNNVHGVWGPVVLLRGNHESLTTDDNWSKHFGQHSETAELLSLLLPLGAVWGDTFLVHAGPPDNKSIKDILLMDRQRVTDRDIAMMSWRDVKGAGPPHLASMKIPALTKEGLENFIRISKPDYNIEYVVRGHQHVGSKVSFKDRVYTVTTCTPTNAFILVRSGLDKAWEYLKVSY
jgi:hypothetical protein